LDDGSPAAASSSFGCLTHCALCIGTTRIFIDAPLDLWPEMPQQALDRPSGTVAKGADGVTFDLLRHLHQHVDLTLLRPTFRHAGEDAPHPSHAFAARRALAAAFVLVEIRDAGHRADNIG